MNKISAKLTAYFFIVVCIMEISLIGYLRQNIVHSRIEEEFSRLLETGSNHRDVLTEYYSETTVKHIVLMEKGSDRSVLITNESREVIASSEQAGVLEGYIPNNLPAGEDRIIAEDWKDSPYIISAHPYSAGEEQQGAVVMFQSTDPIEQLVHKLNVYFVLAGVISGIALLIIYAALSKILTSPLIRMKNATEKLSGGNFDVSLPFIGNDELGELSGSIQKLADDLERLKKERNEFLASIAHEISTPLTYLIGYSKVAMRQGLDDEERRHYLTIIEEESDRIKQLVDNLLELAKMDENSFTIVKEHFAARPFFEDLQKRMEPSFLEKNMTLSLVCDEGTEVYADVLRLEQIVLNVLDNALKHSLDGSEVKVEVSEQDGKTRIAVTDFGTGIPAEHLPFIFEKLYRVDKSRSRASGGSGIGLAVVKELAEAHGGSVEAESRVGEGSTFTIVL